MTSRKAIIWGAAIVAVAALLCIYWMDPGQVAWYPKCPIKLLTGWDCPGCGSSRALHALLHGEVGRALAFNPIWVVGIPYVLILSWLEYFGGKERCPQLRQAMTSRVAAWIILGVLGAYTVVRNLI